MWFTIIGTLCVVHDDDEEILVVPKIDCIGGPKNSKVLPSYLMANDELEEEIDGGGDDVI